MTVPSWMKKSPILTTILFVILFLGALGAAAKAVDQYRWWVYLGEFKQRSAKVDQQLKTRDAAVKSQLDKIQTRITANKRSQVELNIDVLRGQLFTVDREIRSYKDKGRVVPDSLYRERSRLFTKINKLERSTTSAYPRP